jgi:hypothetical protein
MLKTLKFMALEREREKEYLIRDWSLRPRSFDEGLHSLGGLVFLSLQRIQWQRRQYSLTKATQ